MWVELVVETELSSSLDQLWTKSVHAATCATLFVRSVLKLRAKNLAKTLHTLSMWVLILHSIERDIDSVELTNWFEEA